MLHRPALLCTWCFVGPHSNVVRAASRSQPCSPKKEGGCTVLHGRLVPAVRRMCQTAPPLRCMSVFPRCLSKQPPQLAGGATEAQKAHCWAEVAASWRAEVAGSWGHQTSCCLALVAPYSSPDTTHSLLKPANQRPRPSQPPDPTITIPPAGRGSSPLIRRVAKAACAC